MNRTRGWKSFTVKIVRCPKRQPKHFCDRSSILQGGMANQQQKNKRSSKKNNRNKINESHQAGNISKKRLPQHVSEAKQDPWWQSSLKDEECPITLEPFATSPYPPFCLSDSNEHHGIYSHVPSNISTDRHYYFDGFALASYLVARGIFENPLTRQELTIVDCRRLDEYLNVHRQQHMSSSIEQDSRAVSVAEAFLLQQSIQVGTTPSSSTPQGQEEARAQVLRRTATAALAGLFDYSRPHQHRRHQERQAANNRIFGRASSGNEDPRLAEWGLDLSRTIEAAPGQSDHGYTIVDDEEEIVTAAQRDAYEFVQGQFPRLTDSHVEGTAVHNYDESIVRTARSVALQEEQRRLRHAEAIALAQQRLRAMTLQQQQERKQQQMKEWEQGHFQWEQENREKEDMVRARQEIDAWREEQWEKLKQTAEGQVARSKSAKGQAQKDCSSESKDGSEVTGDNVLERSISPLQDQSSTDEEATNNKKATAAAKRKRAKARKQAQKAAARAAIEAKQKDDALIARKVASASRCAACGEGMLDAGFEKFGLKFCSTKCARAAKPPGL
ncbi:unnamed protein product [Cylindrotheca closterium]|uniref:Uncharacterized protein n=1 Tax=Cylindrotheca closterium TaxID=2856 RepID=A0AAD2FQI0_9STRA|nr:unnamed protein product [Cylindrotheca closterium]